MTRGNRKQSHDPRAEGLSLGAQNTSLNHFIKGPYLNQIVTKVIGSIMVPTVKPPNGFGGKYPKYSVYMK